MDTILRALDSPRRRAILRLVWDRERAAGEIHLALGDVTFGAVSQQLRILTEAGLTECRREGRSRFYRARRSTLGPLEAWLESMWDDSLQRLKREAEALGEQRKRTRKNKHKGSKRR